VDLTVETNFSYYCIHSNKQRNGGLTQIKGAPLLRNLEHDPRWRAFLQKMKLPLD
jgi:hypothetical protein